MLLAPGTVGRIAARLAGNPQCDAVIGCNDEQPARRDFVSQYRNLLHRYTHRNGRARCATFWTGCGAIRAIVFAGLGGFLASQRYLEDVELGLRLNASGGSVRLDKGLKAKHLKRIGFLDNVWTDLFRRAIPWTLLVLRFRRSICCIS